MIVTRKEEWPKGLVLYERCFDEAESARIYTYLDKLMGENEDGGLKRQTTHFGYKYPYSIKEPQTAILQKTTDPPEFLKCIGDILTENEMVDTPPNQWILNKYPPGKGIGKHRDHHPIFGNSVATVTFGSGIVMEFRPYFGSKDVIPISIYLPVGSILVFKGDARYAYSHEIASRKNDVVDGKKIPRGDRISVTLRHVNEAYREIVGLYDLVMPPSEAPPSVPPPKEKVPLKVRDTSAGVKVVGVKVLPPLIRKKISVYTDGACKKNPGRGGWGVAIYDSFDVNAGKGDEIHSSYGGEVMTTNNRMEMTAIIEGLKYIEMMSPKATDIILFSDSRLCLKGITDPNRVSDKTPISVMEGPSGWMVGWKKRGWKKGDGEKVLNDDLWREVDSLLGKVIKRLSDNSSTLSFQYVRGHSGDRGNDRADELSNDGVP